MRATGLTDQIRPVSGSCSITVLDAVVMKYRHSAPVVTPLEHTLAPTVGLMYDAFVMETVVEDVGVELYMYEAYVEPERIAQSAFVAEAVPHIVVVPTVPK